MNGARRPRGSNAKRRSEDTSLGHESRQQKKLKNRHTGEHRTQREERKKRQAPSGRPLQADTERAHAKDSGAKKRRKSAKQHYTEHDKQAGEGSGARIHGRAGGPGVQATRAGSTRGAGEAPAGASRKQGGQGPGGGEGGSQGGGVPKPQPPKVRVPETTPTLPGPVARPGRPPGAGSERRHHDPRHRRAPGVGG